MNVLILGSGGREHALVWKLKQSKEIRNMYVAPGNAGTGKLAVNLPIDITDFAQLRIQCIEHNIHMVVVGPEMPLVMGIRDYFKADPLLSSISLIGPSALGAQLEGSKAFAKEFMLRHNIPTAAYKQVKSSNIDEGLAFLRSLKPPYVLKADGLAAGKGVLIIGQLNEAELALKEMLNGRFGQASETVVIEEFLKGIELSVFAITDGISFKMLPSAKDYKRIGEGDTGPNTGGMGAVSPVVFADKQFMEKVKSRVVLPTIEGIRKENIDYKGFLFFGLMNVGGEPYVIEYNVRLGDPEAECILPRIGGDFFALLEACSLEQLDKVQLEIDDRYAVTIVLASGGYPDEFVKGKIIAGITETFDCVVFHAGTSVDIQKDGIMTSGGRVMAVTALDYSLDTARRIALLNAGRIKFEGAYYRKDIGLDLINYKTN